MMDLNIDIYELGLSNRAVKILQLNNINSLKQLLTYNRLQVSQFKGIGDKTLNEIVFKLKDKGVFLRQSL